MAEIIWDSELGPSWPDDWEHTTVHAQFVAVTGDGADTDRLPDIAPSGNGEVVFTPSLRTVRYVGADGPYVVSLKQYRAVVDNEGYLCTPDTFGQPGERGIVLPSTDAEVIEPRGEDDNAFTWRVDFDLPAVTIRSDHIAVPVDGPHNLVDLLSPERAAGVVHIIDRVSARDAKQAAQEATAARDLVLPARDQTLAARDETLQHGITVDTSVGTRIFVGDTMIYGDTGWRDISDLLHEDWQIHTVQGRFRIKRENNTATLDVRIQRAEGSPTEPISSGLVGLLNTASSTLPSGFLPDTSYSAYAYAGAHSGYALEFHASGNRQNLRIRSSGAPDDVYWAPGDFLSVQATWKTTSYWPPSLPGLPE